MYNPLHFKIEEQAQIEAFIHNHPFATLTTYGESGLFATHLPIFYEAGVFYGHIAKANPHPVNHKGEALIMLLGLDGYISPSHYASKKEHGKVVPTWNYEALHVYGTLEFDESDEFKHFLVSKLTQKFETPRAKPWAVSDAPESYIKGQLKGIIGLRFTPSRFEMKRKMSQNRTSEDREGVIKGLALENPPLSAAVLRDFK
jgi:transcriptional regulator